MVNMTIVPLFQDVQLKPGESFQFEVRFYESPTYQWAINMCERWSVEPADAGVTIDDTGFLTVSPLTAPGTHFVVSAHVDEGRGSAIEADLYVWTPETAPLVGRYTEIAQVSCDGTPWTPPHPVGELEFKANGRFNVTWTPWGWYVDYSGDYLYDPVTGMLQMSSPEGEYVPDDFDGIGTATFVPGQGLLLRNIWLGSPPYRDYVLGEGCGHTFQ